MSTGDASGYRPAPTADGDLSFRTVPRQSMVKANIFAAECAVLLAGYGYILLTPGLVWSGCPGAPASLRCQLLLVFGVIYMIRLNTMARWLLPRELATEELTVVILWLLTIMASFALGALPCGCIGWVAGFASVALYCLGSWLNTWSELQRKWWKAHPENKGRCYMLGLFSLSRNINYLGDVLLFAGWSVASGRWWNMWVPVVMAASFYFYHIPDKEAYLRDRYAQDWPAYEERTKAFIPFLC